MPFKNRIVNVFGCFFFSLSQQNGQTKKQIHILSMSVSRIAVCRDVVQCTHHIYFDQFHFNNRLRLVCVWNSCCCFCLFLFFIILFFFVLSVVSLIISFSVSHEWNFCLFLYMCLQCTSHIAYQCEYPKWLTAIQSLNTCIHNVKLHFVVFVRYSFVAVFSFVLIFNKIN